MTTPGPAASPDTLIDDAAHAASAGPPALSGRRELNAASLGLRLALRIARQGGAGANVVEARHKLRALAVKMHDNGFWQADKTGLRETIALLWEADRFVNQQALDGVTEK